MPYEKLRAAIIAAVPEIMELKFGCRVFCEEGWEDEAGNYHDQSGIVTEPADSEGTCLVLVDEIPGVDRFVWPMLPTEVIGRPIALADVLRAIPDDGAYTLKATSDGPLQWWGTVGPTLLDFCPWDLTKDLDGQSDETKKWLESVICSC